MKRVTSIPKRIPKDKADVIDFYANKMEWTDPVIYGKVIEASPIFQKARQLYELSGER